MWRDYLARVAVVLGGTAAVAIIMVAVFNEARRYGDSVTSVFSVGWLTQSTSGSDDTSDDTSDDVVAGGRGDEGDCCPGPDDPPDPTPTPKIIPKPTPKQVIITPVPSAEPAPVIAAPIRRVRITPTPSPTPEATPTPTPSPTEIPPPIPTPLPTPLPSPPPTPLPSASVIDRLGVVLPVVAPPLATFATALAAVSTVLAVAGAASSMSGGMASFMQALFPFLAFHQRRAPWGRVVEAGSNTPVAGALVTVFDAAGRPRTTVKTRKDGTFGVLLPEGAYRFVVTYTGYELAAPGAPVALFPSEKLYDGGMVTIRDEQVLALFVIALSSRGGQVSGAVAGRGWKGFWQRLRVWQARWGIVLLLTGAAITVYALLELPTWFYIVLALVYLFLLGFELVMSQALERALGRVRDAAERQPVSLALVRLVDEQSRRIVATEVTSPRGQFLLVPPAGTYRLQVAHTQYQPHVQEHYRAQRFFLASPRIAVALTPRQAGGGG